MKEDRCVSILGIFPEGIDLSRVEEPPSSARPDADAFRPKLYETTLTFADAGHYE
jgi:hypothetical protein